VNALSQAALVGLGGALGALARHGVGVGVVAAGAGLWWATLAVNLLGCFAAGALTAWTARGGGAVVVPLVSIGFLGAFTTFSRFAVDALVLERDAGGRAVAAYVAASVIGGLAAAWLGVRAFGGMSP
jgi:CrcB protein